MVPVAGGRDQALEEISAETRTPLSWGVWFLIGVRIYPVELFVYHLGWRAQDWVRNRLSPSSLTKTPDRGRGRCQRCHLEEVDLAAITLRKNMPCLWVCNKCADAIGADARLFGEVVKSLRG